MSRPKNVYLSKRAMVVLRHSDSLSGRINQIIERYLAITTPCEARVRAAFAPDEWQRMLGASKALGPAWPADSIRQVIASLGKALGEDTAAARHIAEYDLDECMALLELLERDVAAASAPPATQS